MQGARGNTEEMKGGEKLTMVEGDRGKIPRPLPLLLLLLLLSLAGGATAEGADKKLFVRQSSGWRCGTAAADAEVASLVQCAALCARETTCSGFSLGAAGAPEGGRRRACHPVASHSPCHIDPAFNFYVADTQQKTDVGGTTTTLTTTEEAVQTTTTSVATTEATGTATTPASTLPEAGATTSNPAAATEGQEEATSAATTGPTAPPTEATGTATTPASTLPERK
ncbi:uncharacterized protein LOC125039837 [Penaeus chinensis]|uniref:uncharacterized protein LOC125039837 n=1 Tax=Penaeus chinensis TaxID=139456 RepID=UPI001FB6B4A9|nr:uncharacterized protein LOC125039837 [Penaeus chinensis]